MVSHLDSQVRIASALNNDPQSLVTHHHHLSPFPFPVSILNIKAGMALKSDWVQIMAPALIICDLGKFNYHILP